LGSALIDFLFGYYDYIKESLLLPKPVEQVSKVSITPKLSGAIYSCPLQRFVGTHFYGS
jgi:hypothetical protein